MTQPSASHTAQLRGARARSAPPPILPFSIPLPLLPTSCPPPSVRAVVARTTDIYCHLSGRTAQAPHPQEGRPSVGTAQQLAMQQGRPHSVQPCAHRCSTAGGQPAACK